MKKYKPAKINKENKKLARDTINELLDNRRGLEGMIKELDKEDRLDKIMLGEGRNEVFVSPSNTSGDTYKEYIDNIVEEAKIQLTKTEAVLEGYGDIVEYKVNKEGKSYVLSLAEDFELVGAELSVEFLETTQARIDILTSFTEIYQDIAIKAQLLNPEKRFNIEELSDEDYAMVACKQHFNDFVQLRHKHKNILTEEIGKVMMLKGFENDKELINIHHEQTKDFNEAKVLYGKVVEGDEDSLYEIRKLLTKMIDDTLTIVEECKDIVSVSKDNVIFDINNKTSYLLSNEKDEKEKIISIHKSIMDRYKGYMEESKDHYKDTNARRVKYCMDKLKSDDYIIIEELDKLYYEAKTIELKGE